jgi:hypothetical protein
VLTVSELSTAHYKFKENYRSFAFSCPNQPIQPYHFQAYLIWWDDPFKRCKKERKHRRSPTDYSNNLSTVQMHPVPIFLCCFMIMAYYFSNISKFFAFIIIIKNQSISVNVLSM